MLGIVSLDDISHDTTRLEEVNLLSIGKGIGECWNTAIRVDGEEVWLLLLVLAKVDLVCLVLKAGRR